MFSRRKLIGAFGAFIGLALAAAVWSRAALAQQRANPPSEPGAARAADSSTGATLRPMVTWSGPDSAIIDPSYLRITSAESWLQLWERHSGKPAQRDNIGEPFIPQIDFERCMVVAIFKGRKFNSNGVLCVSLAESGGQLVFRFDERTFQTAAALDDTSGRGGAVDVTPYGIFVVPRSNKSLVIEENVQRLKDHPARWKQQARFD
jgi:hypothetical protein